MIRVLLICGLLLLEGCQTPGGSFCDIARPIRLSENTVSLMSDQEVEDALAHNRKGAKLCRWQP